MADEEEEPQLELMDVFTKQLISEPVKAADGHVYDRASLLVFFADRKTNGLPIVSPYDMETAMAEKMSEAPAAVVNALKQAREDDAALRRAKARKERPKKKPPRFKGLEELRELFDLIDPLGELLAATLKDWKTPMVMVFGNETSGKSSLLERLAMMPILPRGEETCTRLPILLKLRHTDQPKPTALVVRNSATGAEEVRRVVSLAGGQVDVRREMERIIQAECADLKSVSTTRTIEIEVHSPVVPSIDLMGERQRAPAIA